MSILVAALPIDAVLPATELTSHLTRLLRTSDPSLAVDSIIQLPLVDGGDGTIDFLVTHTLGSFLEVEANNAAGEESVVPLGFTGEDGKLAVIEMGRSVGVSRVGHTGSTFGVGELIQDALDEGAFSIILGHTEPLASDGGLGAAAALGVKFLDAKGETISMDRPNLTLSAIDSIDASGRSFGLLSSRIFIAKSQAATETKPSDDLLGELTRLADIIARDTNVRPSLDGLSASGVEFGLRALLGAEVRPGGELILEASEIAKKVESGDIDTVILFADRAEQIQPYVYGLLDKVRGKIVTILANPGTTPTDKRLEATGRSIYLLQDVQLFQPPVPENARPEMIRKDVLMRLEKLIPKLMEEVKKPLASGKSKTKEARA